MSNLQNHPRCESSHPMVVRKSKFGKFYGCLMYPDHKSVVNEPRCSNNHIMALRKNKKTGQEFFSCIKWNVCDSYTYGFEEQPKWYISKLHDEYALEVDEAKKQTKPFQTTNAFYKEYNQHIQNENTTKPNVEKSDESTEFGIRERIKNDAVWDKKFSERFKELDLSEIEIEEFHRLMSGSYGYNQLVKVQDDRLKTYLDESIKNRSVTTVNQLRSSNYAVLSPQDKDWW